MREKVLKLLSHSGAVSAVVLVLSMVGLRNAWDGMSSSLGSQNGRAKVKVAALVSAAVSGVLDIVKASAEGFSEKKIPMLSRWMSIKVTRNGLRIMEGWSGIFGGAGMILLGVMDARNSVEAFDRKEYGMMTLYAINSASEVAVGRIMAKIGIMLIRNPEVAVAEFDPVIFLLSVVIVLASVAIEVFQDPAPMNWVRQCLWANGNEKKYDSESKETEEFYKAITA